MNISNPVDFDVLKKSLTLYFKEFDEILKCILPEEKVKDLMVFISFTDNDVIVNLNDKVPPRSISDIKRISILYNDFKEDLPKNIGHFLQEALVLGVGTVPGAKVEINCNRVWSISTPDGKKSPYFYKQLLLKEALKKNDIDWKNIEIANFLSVEDIVENWKKTNVKGSIFSGMVKGGVIESNSFYFYGLPTAEERDITYALAFENRMKYLMKVSYLRMWEFKKSIKQQFFSFLKAVHPYVEQEFVEYGLEAYLKGSMASKKQVLDFIADLYGEDVKSVKVVRERIALKGYEEGSKGIGNFKSIGNIFVLDLNEKFFGLLKINQKGAANYRVLTGVDCNLFVAMCITVLSKTNIGKELGVVSACSSLLPDVDGVKKVVLVKFNDGFNEALFFEKLEMTIGLIQEHSRKEEITNITAYADKIEVVEYVSAGLLKVLLDEHINKINDNDNDFEDDLGDLSKI